MHFLTSILALATAASAVDVVGYSYRDCTRRRATCTNVQPGSCCFVDLSGSVGFEPIPESWDITCGGYEAAGCQRHIHHERSSRRTKVCITRTTSYFKSGKYHFGAKKRDLEGEDCAVVLPDRVFLDDGTAYDVAGLSREAIANITNVAEGGATHDDLASHFQDLRL